MWSAGTAPAQSESGAALAGAIGAFPETSATDVAAAPFSFFICPLTCHLTPVLIGTMMYLMNAATLLYVTLYVPTAWGRTIPGHPTARPANSNGRDRSHRYASRRPNR